MKVPTLSRVGWAEGFSWARPGSKAIRSGKVSVTMLETLFTMTSCGPFSQVQRGDELLLDSRGAVRRGWDRVDRGCLFDAILVRVDPGGRVRRALLQFHPEQNHEENEQQHEQVAQGDPPDLGRLSPVRGSQEFGALPLQGQEPRPGFGRMPLAADVIHDDTRRHASWGSSGRPVWAEVSRRPLSLRPTRIRAFPACMHTALGFS